MCHLHIRCIFQSLLSWEPLLISLRLTYICSLAGMKTYLISGRKLEHDVSRGCSEFVSHSPHPQPHTPDLISRGVQAAQVLLSHADPDRVGVSKVKLTRKHLS